MIINKEWFGRLYREEAGDQGGEGGGEVSTPDNTGDADAVAEMAGVDAPSKAPEWLLNKYHSEGKTVEEGTIEQAKAYGELSSKFGAFTGAPESYEVSISQELTDSGVEIDAKDPLVQSAIEYAKNSNMSQEGFNDLINLYATQQVAENNALDQYTADQMKELGPNANARVDNIHQWAMKNLDTETVEGIKEIANSANSVKTLERLISMSRGQSVDVDNSQQASSVTQEEVSKMQFEEDSNGNRRINTDQAFKAEYIRKRDALYGTHEHKTMHG